MVKSYGYSGDYNILVMELMGKSLEDLFVVQPEKRFPLKTVCMLADQMLSILEFIHSKHIIHRDIKPDNFVMGLGANSKYLYLLDFGLAKKFRSSSTGIHYPMKNRKKLTGTARYASINALKGVEQSRRDDLEAVGYVLMYFLRGSLPWQGLPVKTKEDRYKKIMEKKLNTSAEELCAGYPSEFADYINYTRGLSYEKDPDYAYLRSLFKNVMKKNNYEFDYVYHWTEQDAGDQSIIRKNTDNIFNNNIVDSCNVINGAIINTGVNNMKTGMCVNLDRDYIAKEKCNINYNEGTTVILNENQAKGNLLIQIPNVINKPTENNYEKTFTNTTPVIQKNNYFNTNLNHLTHSNINCNINMTNPQANVNTAQGQRSETQFNYQMTNLNNSKGNAKPDGEISIGNQPTIKKSKKEKGCCIL